MFNEKHLSNHIKGHSTNIKRKHIEISASGLLGFSWNNDNNNCGKSYHIMNSLSLNRFDCLLRKMNY